MFEQKPRPGDIFVAGYPKSGTKWLQYIIYCILNEGAPPAAISEFVRKPSFQNDSEPAKVDSKPGAMKTHLSFDKAPFSTEAKYVFLCRNPYDTCVSFFHHTACRPAYQFQNGTFDEFLDMFLSGKVDFGDYFDHLLSWYAQRDKPNIFLVTYEDLKKDIRAWVLKIAGFLGEEHAAKLRSDPDLLSRVLKMTGMESVKDLNPTFSKTAQGGRYGRAGVVGDWKECFNPEHVRKMKERIALKVASSDVMNLWNGVDLP
ncbi:unnamed protein product [Ixodes hexagonus]